jgi:RNase P/RNase MRP subunit POP5
MLARVGRENEKLLTSSACLLTSMDGKPCRVRVLHIGGTLEKVEQKYKDLTEAWLENTNKKLELKFK